MAIHRSGPAVARIAVVSYHADPIAEPGIGDAGGMTVYIRRLSAALAGLGVRTDIFTRSTDPADRVVHLSPGVRVIPIAAGPSESLPKEDAARYVGAFVDGVRAFSVGQRVAYDLVHSHYWQSGLVSQALSATWSVPFVHSNHTLGRVKNQALAPGDEPESRARIEGEESVIAAADALVASTEEELSQLSCLYGASHDRIKVQPPGVDHDLFKPGARATARAALGLDQETPVILCVGRIQPLKGFALAVAALDQLVHALDVPPLLLIVGGPSGRQGHVEMERLAALVRASGLEDNVSFTGPRSHDTLPDLYRASDVVAVCSHSESFGFAALEAHACGRPVVGTSVGGLAHIVRPGRSGFLVEDRDPARFAAALKTVLSDRDLARSLGQRAAVSAAEFSWEKSARALLDLYECLVQETHPELCVC